MHIISRLALVVLITVFVTITQASAQETISLSGEWTYRLDKEKKGEQEQWFKQPFKEKLKLPGTLDDAGIGDPATIKADQLNKEVLLHLTRKHSYIGYAWYAKEISIPAHWATKNIELYLERVIWGTRVWIDGQEVGVQQSLSTPQRFNAGTSLKPGKHLITLRIDNSRLYADITWLDMAHAYTDGTQIIWNGVIGKLQLIARSKAYIKSVQTYPSIKDKSVTVQAALQNDGQRNVKGTLEVQVLDKGNVVMATRHVDVSLEPGQLKKEIKIVVGKASLWDEFNPAVYKLKAILKGSESTNDIRSIAFGMREITNQNSMLQVNGRRIFLRGTLECNIFPLTGHPPMDKIGWLKVFSTAKSYGLNHIRFHSWCPPEAAFDVADSLGIYVQVELPYWSGHAGEDEK